MSSVHCQACGTAGGQEGTRPVSVEVAVTDYRGKPLERGVHFLCVPCRRTVARAEKMAKKQVAAPPRHTFLIRSTAERDDETGEPFYWHTVGGWGTREDAERFPARTIALPATGEWVEDDPTTELLTRHGL